MLRNALVVGSLLFMVGCSASSNTIADNQAGMRPGFGGASGYSGYGTPGATAMKDAGAQAAHGMISSEAGMRPGFGGASGYAGYGTPGATAMKDAGAQPAHGMTSSEAGMRPGFGGASGYAGYGTPGKGQVRSNMGMVKDAKASSACAGTAAGGTCKAEEK
jgi:hypothetical protein